MNKQLEESIKREEFKKKFDSLMNLNLDDIKLKLEIKALIEISNIDISYPYTDTFYEEVVELIKNFDQEIIIEKEKIFQKKDVVSKKQYNPKYKKFNKHKKVYKDEYEADRDFKLNIYKKNLFATPYFQEKKRRNAFNFNKSKPKDKSTWKKKGKMHQK